MAPHSRRRGPEPVPHSLCRGHSRHPMHTAGARVGAPHPLQLTHSRALNLPSKSNRTEKAAWRSSFERVVIVRGTVTMGQSP